MYLGCKIKRDLVTAQPLTLIMHWTCPCLVSVHPSPFRSNLSSRGRDYMLVTGSFPAVLICGPAALQFLGSSCLKTQSSGQSAKVLCVLLAPWPEVCSLFLLDSIASSCLCSAFSRKPDLDLQTLPSMALL